MITLTALNQFLDNLEEGILFLDRQRHVVAVNRAARQMLGKGQDEILGRFCPSLFQGTACARNCERQGSCALMTGVRGENAAGPGGATAGR